MDHRGSPQEVGSWGRPSALRRARRYSTHRDCCVGSDSVGSKRARRTLLAGLLCTRYNRSRLRDRRIDLVACSHRWCSRVHCPLPSARAISHLSTTRPLGKGRDYCSGVPPGALQSGSPPGAWINREVSGDEANFVQDGVVRASGTFSSPSGLTTFTILSFALALALSLQPGPRRRFGFVMLLPAAIVALVSGSRGTIFGILIVLVVAAVVTLARRPSDVVRLLVGLSVGITVGYWAVSAFWPEVLNALFSRFDDAAQAEDTGGRLFGQTFGFLLGEFPIFGLGPGAASLSGIALGSGATWVEVDSARWVAELGLIGLAAGIARLSLALYLTARLVTGARTLPWLAVCLIAVIVPILASGSITQNPTTQAAFGVTSTLLLGVMLAVREPSPTAPSNQATTPGGLNSMTTKGKT